MMLVQIPVTTEVIEKNADLQPSGKVEENRIVIEFDTRKPEVFGTEIDRPARLMM